MAPLSALAVESPKPVATVMKAADALVILTTLTLKRDFMPLSCYYFLCFLAEMFSTLLNS